MARTITNPADSSNLDSSVIRNELQLLETEIANTSTGHDHDGSDSKLVLVTNLDVTGLTANKILRVNSGGTAIESYTTIAVADGGTGASDATTARTNLGVDPAGTDNSTNVTIATGLNYITITGQELTLGSVDLTTDVTGLLPDANISSASTWNAKEPGLGNPSTDGYVLSSTALGVRSWIVAGGGGSASGVNAGINVETLSADKTITAGTDPMYQYLDPNGANRIITMATSTASAGDRFVIKNNGASTITYYLQINQGATALDYIYAQGSKVFIFDGIDWQGADNGSKDGNVAVGQNAQGFSYGAAIGSYANGHSLGAAVGFNANGYTNGAAVGYTAFGYSNGAVLGYQAIGRYNGVSIGYQAGVNLGTQNPGGNVLLGYQAGDNLTTGTYNIVLGYDVDAPAIGSTQTLNIGNLIYGTGLDGTGTTLSTGNIGIGVVVPTEKLDVSGNGLFSGTLTASNLSGTNTGDQTTITGNAGTATALQTARLIGGVSFDGTADIVPNIVTDTTPQLGGQLDAQANSIGFTLQTYTGVVGTTAIDFTKGNKHQFTFGAGNETLTFTAPAKPGNFVLYVIQDATGGRTLTYPATVRWAGGTAPTLSTAASAVDIISFIWNGTNYDGVASLNFA